jgi:hypothetical protein
VSLTYVQSWALAFVITQLVELPIYRALAPIGWGRAFSLSLVTHPVVWYGFPPLCERAGLSWTQMIGLAEAFAYLVEAALLCGYGVKWWRALAVSCVANTASVAVGELMRAQWGIP